MGMLWTGPGRATRAQVVVSGVMLSLLAAFGASAQERLRPPSALHPELDQLGRSIAQERCRKPLKVHRERVPSAASAKVMDAVHTTTCEGFEVVLFQPAKARRGAATLPMVVTVTGAHTRVPREVAVGAAAAVVRERLGAPYEARADSLTYALSAERPDDDFVTFRLEQGRVSAIEWTWVTD